MSLETAPPTPAAAMDQHIAFCDQIACLTEQVAALAAQVQSNRQQPQVRQYYYHSRYSRSCLNSVRVGHIAR